MSKRITTTDFIARSKIVHGDKYDYSNTIYTKAIEKVQIKCKMHSEFNIKPFDHLRGKGCPKCGTNRMAESKKYNTEKITKMIVAKHGDAYDLSLIKYVDCLTPIELVCKKHGAFKISPQDILHRSKCPMCVKDEHSFKYKWTTEKFIEEAVLIHGSKYDYSSTIYEGANKRVKILCKKHNEHFTQFANHHLSGVGCPRCKESKGEVAIRNYLLNNSIDFIPQYSTNDCKNIGLLYFDFAIRINNKLLLVEFNGIQHYKSIKYFGGDDRFYKCVENDNIKKNYCQSNNIPLLIIKYNEIDKVGIKLRNFISSNS